jgi:hypothetical protein
VLYFAGQLGVCWAELGPHYDSPNEAVIPAVAIVALADHGGLSAEFRVVGTLTFGQTSSHKGLLPPPPSGAIMKQR